MPDQNANDQELLAALADIQRRGAIGEASLPAAVAHADQFVVALPPAAHRLIDLGSGGGLPGLVIAVRRRDLAITLVERRRSRADLLQRAVRRLRLEHVTVYSGDVREVAAAERYGFDVVSARSFAAPAITAHWAGELLRAGGLLVVSEPPHEAAERWPEAVLEAAELKDLGVIGGVRRLQKVANP